jgi:hypothetical protein
MAYQWAAQTKETETGVQRKAVIAPHLLLATRPPVHPILQLQRQIGNRAVTQLIQAKLQVGEPGDVLEQEADRIAETVMRMPDPLIQQQSEAEERGNSAVTSLISVQRRTEHSSCRDANNCETLQRDEYLDDAANEGTEVQQGQGGKGGQGVPSGCPQTTETFEDVNPVPVTIMAIDIGDLVAQISKKLEGGTPHTAVDPTWRACLDEKNRVKSILLNVRTTIVTYRFVAGHKWPQDAVAAMKKMEKMINEHEHRHREITKRVLKNASQSMAKATSEKDAEKVLDELLCNKHNPEQEALDKVEGTIEIFRNKEGALDVRMKGYPADYKCKPAQPGKP